MPTVLLGCLYSTLEWASLAKAEGACRLAPWLFSEIASQQNRSSLGRKKKSLGCSDHRYMGKTPNLLSLQVEGLHLPSWLVPNTGSLLPTRIPRMSWQKSKHIYGIGSASLRWNLVEQSMRGWQGTGLRVRGRGAWVGLKYMTTLAMKIKPTRSSLRVVHQIPFLFSFSCSLFCLPDSLTTWFLWNRKSSNTTEESELRLWHPWLSQTPETVEIFTASPSLRFPAW